MAGPTSIPDFRAVLTRAIACVVLCAATAVGGCERGSSPVAGSSTGSPQQSAASDSASVVDPVAVLYQAVPRAGIATVDDDRIRIVKRMLAASEFADAETASRAVLKSKPDCARAELFLGVSIQKQKRYGEARPHFERVITLRQPFPEVDHVFHFLGWCCYYLGDLNGAKAAFTEHVRRMPEDGDSRFGLAIVA